MLRACSAVVLLIMDGYATGTPATQTAFVTVQLENPGVKTPNLDRMAARGVLFAQSYVATPP